MSSRPSHPPRLVIAGASGVVGRALVHAAADRYDVTVLTRRVSGAEPAGARARAWNPTAARDQDHDALADLAEAIAGAEALVNLAGSSIAAGRFGPAHRAELLSSRLTATETLVHAAALAPEAPSVWLQGSAVGLYGDRGEEELHDGSSAGTNLFLCEVGQAWEAAAAPAAERSRLVVGRIGLALHPEAEAWRRLLLPIRLFVGGPLGSGRQWWPWIHADDLARAMLFVIEHDAFEGPVALTAPAPARQIEVTRAAAARLGRPAFVPVPAFALRIVLGRMADELLLPSARVVPRRLLEAGFEFRYGTIQEAVEGLLGD